MAVLLCTVVLLTSESETPESLIADIKTGSPSKRWQKAYELSNELNQGRGMLRSSGVMKEVIHILSNADEYDPKTRSYMAMALSHFDEPEVNQVLQKVLAVEESTDVQIFLIWALGIKEAKQAEELVLKFLKDEEEPLRKMAAYALGTLGSQKSVQPLSVALEDKSEDVSWNSAISLARLGSDKGYSELLKMIDRKSLSAREHLDEAKIEEIMVSAVKGIALLNKADSIPYIETLSKEDKSLKVRQAAIVAFKALKQ